MRASVRLTLVLSVVLATATLVAGCNGGAGWPLAGSTKGAPATIGPVSPGPTTPSATATPTPSASAPPAATTTAPPPATPSPTPTAKPTPSVGPSATPRPAPTVSTATVSSKGPGGRWTVTFKKPVVSRISTAAGKAINDAIAARVSSLIGAFTSVAPPMSDNQPSALEGTYSVAFVSPDVLSLRYAVSEFASGAMHPDHQIASQCFLVSDGSLVHLGDLFSNQASAWSILSTQSRKQLRTQLGSDLADWIDTGTAPASSSFDASWALTSAGLEITFPEYAVGPYSDGTPKVVVPWSALASVVKPNGAAGGFVD